MKNCVSQAKKAWRLPWKSMNSEDMQNDLELNRSSLRCQYWKNGSSCIFDRAVLNFHSSDSWCRLATGAKNSTHTSPLPRIGKSGFDKTFDGKMGWTFKYASFQSWWFHGPTGSPTQDQCFLYTSYNVLHVSFSTHERTWQPGMSPAGQGQGRQCFGKALKTKNAALT